MGVQPAGEQSEHRKGYVIEAEDGGHYLHRAGYWVRYASPSEGYVWSPEEAAAIVETARDEWEMKPAKLHPATYNSRGGITAVTSGATTVDDVSLPQIDPDIVVTVPNVGGRIIDLGSVIAGMDEPSFVGVSISL